MINAKNLKTQKIILFSIAMVAVLFLTYTYLVITTTITITAKKQTSIVLENMQSEVADLELSYITQSNAITLDRAYELGFVSVFDNAFAYNKTGDDYRLALYTNQ